MRPASIHTDWHSWPTHSSVFLHNSVFQCKKMKYRKRIKPTYVLAVTFLPQNTDFIIPQKFPRLFHSLGGCAWQVHKCLHQLLAFLWEKALKLTSVPVAEQVLEKKKQQKPNNLLCQGNKICIFPSHFYEASHCQATCFLLSQQSQLVRPSYNIGHDGTDEVWKFKAAEKLCKNLAQHLLTCPEVWQKKLHDDLYKGLTSKF